MNTFKKLFIVLLAFTLGACASIAEVTKSPEFQNKNGQGGMYVAMLTFVDSSAFAPSTKTEIPMLCRHNIDGETIDLNSKDAVLAFRDSKCSFLGDPRNHAGAGYMTSLGSAVVNSAGIAAAGYFVGKGIGDSGDTYTDNSKVNTDNKVKGTNAQAQRQGQGQHQGQSSYNRNSNSSKNSNFNANSNRNSAGAIAGANSSSKSYNHNHNNNSAKGGLIVK